MDISVTELKQRCLEIVRRVERTGKPVVIRRRGRVVAQLEPALPSAAAGGKPWERLRGRARWLAAPGESFVREGELKGPLMAVLLDTHVWAWWLSGDERLPARERNSLDRLAARGELRLCAISLWEAQMAYSKGRFRPADPFEAWLRAATAADVLAVVPIDVRVALALNDLPASLPSDPADRLIVACARAHALPLATHDRVIRRSRAVRLWRG